MDSCSIFPFYPQANMTRVDAAHRSFQEMASKVTEGKRPSVTQACMRPCASDALPIIGQVPGVQNGYIGKCVWVLGCVCVCLRVCAYSTLCALASGNAIVSRSFSLRPAAPHAPSPPLNPHAHTRTHVHTDAHRHTSSHATHTHTLKHTDAVV